VSLVRHSNKNKSSSKTGSHIGSRTAGHYEEVFVSFIYIQCELMNVSAGVGYVNN